MTQSIYEHQVSFKDSSLRGLIYGSAAFCLFLLACMVLYIIYQGFAAMSWQFVSTATSATKGIVGILGNIINTLYVVACTLAMAVPLGVGSAIYLNEYAKRGDSSKLLNLRRKHWPVFHPSFRMSALGLGASKWYMIRTIILPSAMPGIITGTVLALGRVIGESAALLFTAGSGYFLSKYVVMKIFQPGGTLLIQMYIYMQNADYVHAFGIAVILVLLVLALNILAQWITRSFQVQA